MKALRVVITLVAMLALPLVAARAQGRGKGVRPNSETCSTPAGNSGKVPPGQAKKCPEPTPDPNPPPPSGSSFANGTVFADLDADGVYSPFSGDTVLSGVAVQLLWQGAVYKSATTDANGAYRFDGLGDTGTNLWELCVSVPAGFVQGPAQPGGYTGCSGTGYGFGFNNGGLTSMYQGNFSMLPQ
jgi:hypothetical protein